MAWAQIIGPHRALVNILLCIPLDSTSETKREILATGQSIIFAHFVQVYAVESGAYHCLVRLNDADDLFIICEVISGKVGKPAVLSFSCFYRLLMRKHII